MTPQDISLLIGTFLPEPHAGLLSGMLVGTKEALSKDLNEALIITGTLHIVALSGTNITILAKIAGGVLGSVFSRRVASLLTIVFLIGFTVWTGASPSVVRAAIMGCTTLLGALSGRKNWTFWGWLVAAVSMLAFEPSLLANVSYQLSVGAALGIILFGEEKNGRTTIDNRRWKIVEVGRKWIIGKLFTLIPFPLFHRLRSLFYLLQLSSIIHLLSSEFRSGLRTTLSAQLFTIPIIFFTFRQISFISPLPNILIGWIIEIITEMGISVVILGLICPPLGQVAAWIAWVPLEYVIRVVIMTSRIPLASFNW